MMSLHKDKFLNSPSLIEYGKMRFLIFDAPNDDDIRAYAEIFKKYHVSTIVRVCDPTYSADILKNMGFAFHDLPFPDGNAPPKSIVQSWLSICKSVYNSQNATENQIIGVHCVAGLGRAPVLVCIALINEGMNPADAVQFVRNKRKGAINQSQLKYLINYKKSQCTII